MSGWRRRDHLLLALAGLAVLGISALGAREGSVPAWEREVFHAINDLPQWLYRPLWIFQQFGNIVIAVLVVVVIAIALRKPKLALAAVLAAFFKLGGERAVKAVVERKRPGSSIGDVVARGDVSSAGLSFVSGHATITAAMATILTPYLPGRWKLVPWVVVFLNGFTRIYVAAHNPLDIVGGVGLGLFIGGVINAVLAPGTAPSTAIDEPRTPVEAEPSA